MNLARLMKFFDESTPRNGAMLLVAAVGGTLAILSITLLPDSGLKALVFSLVIVCEIGTQLWLLSSSRKKAGSP